MVTKEMVKCPIKRQKIIFLLLIADEEGVSGHALKDSLSWNS